jgi:hypothetical protein
MNEPIARRPVITNMNNPVRIWRLRLAWLVLTVALAPRPAAWAQDSGRVEVAGGYSWLRDYEGVATFPRGWFASVASDMKGPLALVGEASGSYKSMGGLDIELSLGIHTFMGGPRVVRHGGRLHPYAQMLFGISRMATRYTLPDETLSAARHHLAMAPGGGLDVSISERAAVRVGTSLRLIRAEQSTPTGSERFNYRELQVLAGIVVR